MSSSSSTVVHRYRLYQQEKTDVFFIVDILLCVEINEQTNNDSVPIRIRGSMSEGEQFIKTGMRGMVSDKSVEYHLEEEQNVILLAYLKQQEENLVKWLVKNKISLSSYNICPILIESQVYQNEYSKILGNTSQMVHLAWKGLFDQLVIIGSFPFNQQDLASKLDAKLEQRKKYQKSILEAAANAQQWKKIQQNKSVDCVEGDSSLKNIIIFHKHQNSA